MRACEGRRAPTGGKGDRGHPALLARPDSRGPVATQGPPASEVLRAPPGVPGAKASRVKLVTPAGMAGLGWTLSGPKANEDPSVCVLPACTHVHASLRIRSLSCALLYAEVEQVPCTPEPKDMLMIFLLQDPRDTLASEAILGGTANQVSKDTSGCQERAVLLARRVHEESGGLLATWESRGRAAGMAPQVEEVPQGLRVVRASRARLERQGRWARRAPLASAGRRVRRAPRP